MEGNNMQNIVIRVSNNEKVDLSKLSISELYRLHFEEEKYVANKLKNLPPFSNERTKLLNKGYEIIESIKEYRNYLEDINHVRIIKPGVYKVYLYNLFIKVLKKIKNKNGKITVLELGCGKCVFLNKISSIPNLDLYGCDLHPSNSNKNVKIIKDTIYNTLNKFKDNSIDILVADNVCEHFLKDEADIIYELIRNKLKKRGKIIFLIPNIYFGPSDISRKYLKEREKPIGFHFMEQSYKDNIKLFNEHKLYTDYIVSKNGVNPILIKNFYILDKVLLHLESFFGNLRISRPRKKFIFERLGYMTYVLKK